jgi:ABC-type multidrug transport system fused ATPase/permease subunit
VSTATGWRGVAAEQADEVSGRISALLRRRSRRLLGSLLAPHRRRVVVLVVVVLLQNAAAMAGPWLVALGIDRGIPAVRSGHAATLFLIVGILVVAALCQAWLYRTFVVGAGEVGQELLLDLRQRVFAKFQQLSLAFHERYTSGRVISRLTSDLDAITELLDAGLDTLVVSALSIVSIGVILLFLDVPLGLVSLGAFVPLLALTRWFQLRSTTAYRRTREAVALVVIHFTESLGGIRAVQAFRREARNDEIFAQVNDDYRAATQRAFQLVTVYWPGIRLIGNITTALVLLYGGLRVINGDLQVGVLAAFLLYLRRFFEPMAEISQFYDSFQGAAASLEKLSGVLEEEPSVAMAHREAPVPSRGWRGDVRFDRVSFGYREDDDVLTDLNLSIPAGQTVALLGRTGAGKTTIARLLARFYDPDEGEVAVDGTPLPTLTESQLRRLVAMVTQENFLFSGSVADNIALGRPEATREEIEAAAEAIGADAFIEALPDGYETDVGKRGSRLSAGQRQLVAFARAFLADPAVLILDEATSSLDVPTERAVQRALRTVLADRTALIIAHRLSTVEIADRVLVIEGGLVVEDGAPASLLEAGGHYSRLHEAWRESLA